MKSDTKLACARPLRRGFYDRDVVTVARELLGTCLVRTTEAGLVAGRMVEVEAYLAADDPANHAYRGRSRRNASMFGPPGHAYVYAIHSRWCLNAVTEPEGVPSAVLIRAVEPLAGLDLMRKRRRMRAKEGRSISDSDLARGPARLCEAFAIDRTLDGWDLTRGAQLWIARDSAPLDPDAITASPRVGVTSACDEPLRFYIAGSPFVSRLSGRKDVPPVK
jgi:DNA-3-methyladenine glycosylase